MAGLYESEQKAQLSLVIFIDSSCASRNQSSLDIAWEWTCGPWWRPYSQESHHCLSDQPGQQLGQRVRKMAQGQVQKLSEPSTASFFLAADYQACCMILLSPHCRDVSRHCHSASLLERMSP